MTPEELELRASELAGRPAAVQAYLAVRINGSLSSSPESHSTPLTHEQVLLLECTGPLLDRGQVIQAVKDGIAGGSGATWDRSALDLLRWHAMSSEVLLLVRLAEGKSDRTSDASARLNSFRTTLAAVMGRDVGAFSALRSVTLVSDPVGIAIIRAAGMAGDPEGLTWLTEQLDEEGLADAALQEIGRLARLATDERAVEIADKVRPFLESENPSRRRHAMRALADMGDAQLIPWLIEVLEGPESGEHKSALAALKELSGRTLPANAAAWRGWYEEELRWWREEAEATFELLASLDEAAVITGIRTISRHSLGHDRLARRVASLVRGHESAFVRGQACLALAHLGSMVAVDDLVHALEDVDEVVRGHALTALRSLTGLSFPLDRSTWEDALRVGE